LTSKFKKFKNYLNELHEFPICQFLIFVDVGPLYHCAKIQPLPFVTEFFWAVHVFSDLVFFGLILRPNSVTATSKLNISRTRCSSQLKFAAFFKCWEYYSTMQKYRRHASAWGQGSPLKIGRKLEISKIKPRWAGSGAKCFRGSGPGRAYVLGDPIA